MTVRSIQRAEIWYSIEFRITCGWAITEHAKFKWMHLRRATDLVWCCISAFWATCKFRHSLAQFARLNASWIVFVKQRFTSDFHSRFEIILARNVVSYCKFYVAYRNTPYTVMVVRIRAGHVKRSLHPRTRCEYEMTIVSESFCVFEYFLKHPCFCAPFLPFRFYSISVAFRLV